MLSIVEWSMAKCSRLFALQCLTENSSDVERQLFNLQHSTKLQRCHALLRRGLPNALDVSLYPHDKTPQGHALSSKGWVNTLDCSLCSAQQNSSNVKQCQAVGGQMISFFHSTLTGFFGSLQLFLPFCPVHK